MFTARYGLGLNNNNNNLARSTQSMPPPHVLKIHFNIILPSTSGSSTCPLPLNFPQKNPVHASSHPHTRYMPCPSHSRFYHPNNIGWAVQIIKLFLHSPVTSSFLYPTILLNTLFSDTLSLHSSIIVSDQVSHPYTTTGKILKLALRGPETDPRGA